MEGFESQVAVFKRSMDNEKTKDLLESWCRFHFSVKELTFNSVEKEVPHAVELFSLPLVLFSVWLNPF